MLIWVNFFDYPAFRNRVREVIGIEFKRKLLPPEKPASQHKDISEL